MDIFQHAALRDLPTFTGLHVDESALPGITDEAYEASNLMARQGYFEGTMPAGFRVAESSRVTFNREGHSSSPKANEMVILVDPQSDPVLQLIAQDVDTRFAAFDGAEFAELITAYSRLLLEPAADLPVRDWESLWWHYCLRNRSQLVRLGWLVKNRIGPCLPMAMLAKFASDRRGFRLILAQGCYLDDFAEPHAWTVRETGAKLLAYDPARLKFGVEMDGLYEVDQM